MISSLSTIAVGFLFGNASRDRPPINAIAVSTIVSREGNIKHASMMRVAWGIGQTLTIVAVGRLSPERP